MDYSSLNAKIKAMGSMLFVYEDFVALSKLKTVEELGRRLRELPAYKTAMESLRDDELTRNPIERKIVLSLSDDFSRIYSFITDHRIRRFLDAYFLKNEIHIIKLLLCSVFDERDVAYSLPEANNLLGKKLFIDIPKLETSKTVSEFIENLKGTEFHTVLNDIYDDFSTLFELEMHLDIYYYMNLWRKKDTYLQGENKETVTHIIGTEMDLMNIMWVYRLKTYYNLPSDKIYTNILPINYRLSSAVIKRLVETKTSEELMDEIYQCYYGKFFRENVKLEKVFYKEMVKVLKKSCVQHPKSLAVTLDYMFYKEVEEKNIISLLEGIRYGLEYNEILKYLTLTHDMEVG